MNEKSITQKLTEIQKEVTALNKQIEKAAPDMRVQLEAKKDVLKKTLETMEAANSAINAAQDPRTLPTPDKIASCLNKYLVAHDVKVQAAVQAISDKQEQIRKVTGAMKQAAEIGDVEKAAVYAKKKAEEEKALEYLESAVEEIKKAAIFPVGAVADEWESVCREYAPAYQAALEAAKEATIAYKKANAAFMDLHNTLLQARSAMQQIARKNGSDQSITNKRILTAGMNAAEYNLITKFETVNIGNAVSPAFSGAL